jgi:hypothetical protein
MKEAEKRKKRPRRRAGATLYQAADGRELVAEVGAQNGDGAHAYGSDQRSDQAILQHRNATLIAVEPTEKRQYRALHVTAYLVSNCDAPILPRTRFQCGFGGERHLPVQRMNNVYLLSGDWPSCATSLARKASRTRRAAVAKIEYVQIVGD